MPRTRHRFIGFSFTFAIATLLLAPAPAECALPASLAARQVGLGFDLGTGPGLSAKFYLDGRNAVQLGLGTAQDGRMDDHGRWLRGGTTLHADYLRTLGHVVTNASVDVPWYLGVGGVLNLGGGDGVGVRVPLGVAMQYTRVPLDVFVEWAPQAWLGSGFELARFTLRMRYWF